ncbi:MAG: transglycosylase domain-containing protein, partial [Myxococcota bacterium]
SSMIVGERVVSAFLPFPVELVNGLPQSVCVHAADGTVLRVFATVDDERVIPVPLTSMSSHLRTAVLRQEDERFYSHCGVDLIAGGRAALQNLRGGRVVSGASTITMQVVRVLMPGSPRSFGFKLVQVFRARQLERLLSKDEILELYLNHVPLGGAVRGFEAAARRWFGVGAAALTASQAATLVAMLPAPSYRSPRRRPELLRRLRDRLLDRMSEAGDLISTEFNAAAAKPLGMKRRPWPYLAPHAVLYLAGRSRDPVLRSQLDLPLQQALESLAARHDTRTSDALAIVVLDRKSGALCAMIGSPDFAHIQLNTATCSRSLGSTLKPFLYALAMEQGVVPVDGMIDDRPWRFGDYRPANFSRDYIGSVRVGEALATSRNLPALRLLEGVTTDGFASLLHGLGLPSPRRDPGLTAALGTGAASPLRLAEAYRIFVEFPERLGLRRATVTRILDALSVQPIVRGAELGRLAWKTGTSSGRRDAWCVGVDQDSVAVVWMGNLGGRGEPGLVGAKSAARLLARVVSSRR